MDFWSILPSRNVQEFLHIYERKYDLLLLDVTLPDGNGFEICEKVRKESEVPILFLTAADEEFNVVRGLDMGGTIMCPSLPA